LHFGPIPENAWVLHRCDTRLCVRPDHLFLGDNATNMADMKAKARGRGGTPFHRQHARWESRAGERSNSAKLTTQRVNEIRSRYQAGGVTLRSLAAEYGVHNSTIERVLKGRTWMAKTT
jgi:lambda repressor-like predicted transcriptional regulator